MLPGPVNTIRYLFGGEGAPLVLLPMPVRPYGLTGTALPPFSRRQRERGSPSPPSPPTLPQRAFIRGKSWDKGRIARQGRWSMSILFHVYIEIISKICVNRPWSIFVLKKENARRQHSAARPKPRGKTAFFSQNDRPYGLERNAYQTENARGRPATGAGPPGHVTVSSSTVRVFAGGRGARRKGRGFLQKLPPSPANSKSENQRAPKPGTWKRRSSQCRSQVARVTMMR